MCLCGVDYFSTLGYQPSIAFEGAGFLSPVATLVLVLVTLLGALPVYLFVTGRAPDGVGSIGMLEQLFRGWIGKIAVLVLIGFAATDFVITKTLSAADAAAHLIGNPLFAESAPPWMQGQMVVTMFLLVLLGGLFLKGYDEVVGVATVLVIAYLALSFVIIVSGLIQLVFVRPELLHGWYNKILEGNYYIEHVPISGKGFWVIIGLAVLIFPKLALGLSGFETGVLHVHLVQGTEENPNDEEARVANTRMMLISAAVIMSFFLIGSSLVTGTGTLIPPEEYHVVHDEEGKVKLDAEGRQVKGKAVERALAYLAHGQSPELQWPIFGPVFGTIYDISTILILWFAGASAMSGLLNMVPRYLPRYGMAPEWASAYRPLVLVFTAINLLVTYLFNADVTAQGGAYATGVLVLITSACTATVIQKWRTREGRWYRRLPWTFAIITLVFIYTTADVVITKPDGIRIAIFFIVAILATSLYSRIRRSRELRFSGFHIPDGESKFFWDTIKHLELSVLVPHRPGRRSLVSKEASIRREHRIPRDLIIVFVEVELLDASDFYQEPWLTIRQEEGRYVMKITHAASIAHTLAALSLEMAKVGRPPEIHFGWTDETPWSGTLGFLLFGEGNVPWMVRELIRHAEPHEERRPMIVVAGK